MGLMAGKGEEDQPEPTVSTLERIWNSLKPTIFPNYRALPKLISTHIGLNHHLVQRKELWGYIFNHCLVSGYESLFVCRCDIQQVPIPQSVALATTEILLPYTNRLHMSKIKAARNRKRTHDCDEWDSSKDSTLTRRTVIADVPVTCSSMLRNTEDMSLGSNEVEDMLEQANNNSSILEADVADEISRLDSISISGQVSHMLKQKKVTQLENELKLSLAHIEKKLKEGREKKEREKDGEIYLSSDEEVIEEVFSSIPSESSPSTSQQIPSISKPISSSRIHPSSSSTNAHKDLVRRVSLYTEEDDLWTTAVTILETYKNSDLNYSTLGKMVLTFQSMPILLSSEIFETAKRGKVPQSAREFFNKNLIKLIYNQSIVNSVDSLDHSHISNCCNATNEVQCWSNFRETELFLENNEKAREGPSTLTITKALIPYAMLTRFAAIIVGSTNIYRQLYSSEQKFLYDQILNLSAPQFLNYNEKMDASNELYIYLLEVLGQLGTQMFQPPIFVEFYYQKYEGVDCIDAMYKMCRDFIQTLSTVQMVYGGRVVALSPPPYWSPNMTLPKYQSFKYMSRKTAEALSIFGYAKGIYTSAHSICSVPIYNYDRPTIIGYVNHESFAEVPIFLKNGCFSGEAAKRAIHGIRADIRLLRRYKPLY